MTHSRLKFRNLVEEKIGLDLSRRDEAWLTETLTEQSQHAGFSSEESFLDALEAEIPESGKLWVDFVDRMTIAETYFFRDLGQMELLCTQIVPRLVKEAQGRPLRIWSAGCSSGEELYSLAMLLDNTATAGEFWGTDINPVVLGVAREGRYRERSLRGLPASHVANYLREQRGTFEVVPRLRERCRFMVHNLLLPTSSLGVFDLIVCRNVLIYFQRARIPEILQHFFSCLRPGGFLLTGHGELMGLENPFEVLTFPESVVYRRPLATVTSRSAISAPPVSNQQSFESSQSSAISDPDVVAPDVALLCQLGRSARLKGELMKARELLRQAAYLDPGFIPVYLEMSLLVFEEDPDRARKHLMTAMQLLAAEPEERRLVDDIALPMAELERVLF